MEPKKNPKADVSRNGSIYFSVGLALMLFITYSTINYKTYDKSDIDIGLLNMDELDDDEMPITEQVHRVLFEGKPARAAVSDLMGRELKAEIW